LDEQIAVGHPNRKIQWTLTVPAIWSEAAKKIMREAATKVCMNTDNNDIENYIHIYIHTHVYMIICKK